MDDARCTVFKEEKITNGFLRSGAELHTLKGNTGDVYCVVFSADSRRIVNASEDKSVKMWDAESGQVILTFSLHTGFHNGAAFSLDGRRIICIRRNRTLNELCLKVWDARPWTRELRVELEALGVVRFLFDYKKFPKAAVLKLIQADETISEAVHQKALNFAEQYEEFVKQFED